FTITQTGFSYAKREYDWSLLFAINRRLLDPMARRLFFTPNPVRLVVENSPKISVDVPYHPDNSELGSRKIEADGEFYISGGDFEELKEGDILRLKYLMNLKILEKTREYVRAKFLSREPMKNVKIIQWVPVNEAVKVRILIPDLLYVNDEINPDSLKIVDGLGEKAVEKVKADEIIQFERFGFCRRDSESELLFIKAHD
ncbi:MAG TPA: glutamate--tRNA ligase, partial [Nitrososphaeria archaeon]|nr:glutamate--tRNA ligase [Nitrososphaeria archaeon]